MTLEELEIELRNRVNAEPSLAQLAADARVSYPTLYTFIKRGSRMQNYVHFERLARYYGYEITITNIAA